MEIFLVLFVITMVFGMTLASHWVDNKYNLQLVKWLNCEVSSPFKQNSHKQHHTTNHASSCPVHSKAPQPSYDDLKERIENLEKIVTDSSWELNQKIKNL